MASEPAIVVPAGGLQIRRVSELLGVPAPTLRSWERRYGVPTTIRSEGGHRRYGADELQEIRLMRDEIARGLRASDAARSVRLLLDRDSPDQPRITALLEASGRIDPDGLRAVLEESRAELGLSMTIDQVVMPALRQVGAWWEAGRCGLEQEHVTTETIRGWFARSTTLAPDVCHDRPIVLACGPRDQHTVGLEALAALLAERGRGARLMGPRTTCEAVLAAIVATHAEAVVVVSHLRAQRRPAVETVVAVDDTGTAVFYAGNAFSSPELRIGVPGTYLGTSLSVAATTIVDQLQR